MGSRSLFVLLNGVGIILVPFVCVALRVGFGLMGWMFIFIAGLSVSVIPGVFVVQLLLSLLLADQPQSPDRMLLIFWLVEVFALWFASAVIPDFGDTGPGVVSPLISIFPVAGPESLGMGLGWFGVGVASVAAVLWFVRVIWLRSCVRSQQ